jgi:hypothetical protein
MLYEFLQVSNPFRDVFTATHAEDSNVLILELTKFSGRTVFGDQCCAHTASFKNGTVNNDRKQRRYRH